MSANTPQLSAIGWLKGLASTMPKTVRWLLAFSLAVNLLMLVAPLYMLQVYDRVLTSGSTDTLVWLTIISVFLLAIYGAAEAGRRRLAAIAGQRLEDDFARRAFTRFENANDAASALQRDLSNASRLSSPFSNGTILSFVDLPFVPFFILVLAFIHPVLGMLGLIGGAIVLALAVFAELSNRTPTEKTNEVQNQSARFADGLARQRSALVAMGLVGRAKQAWQTLRTNGASHATEASRKESGFTALSRATRQVLQIGILCAGAWLAINQQLSPGGIVASSIVLSRALAPIDLIVGSWRSIVQARSAWSEADERLAGVSETSEYTPLPTPKALLSLDRVSAKLPGSDDPLIRPFTTEIEGGSMIVLTGPNGSGKTTLLQTISAAWPVDTGKVMLGGRSVHDWPNADRGKHVGYLPQEVELLPATIGQNIARLGEAAPEKIVSAAKEAGAHETILALPDGYETRVGPGGIHLSAGQRQSIGLARALFGSPVLLLMDEPTSNLDDAAVGCAIAAINSRIAEGAIALIATHDPRVLSHASQVYELAGGAITARRVERTRTKVSHIRKGAAA